MASKQKTHAHVIRVHAHARSFMQCNVMLPDISRRRGGAVFHSNRLNCSIKHAPAQPKHTHPSVPTTSVMRIPSIALLLSNFMSAGVTHIRVLRSFSCVRVHVCVYVSEHHYAAHIVFQRSGPRSVGITKWLQSVCVCV